MFIIFCIGFVISILLDILCYWGVKNGYEIENYPKNYLTQPLYLTILMCIGWAIIWPVIFGMTIAHELPKYLKNMKKS